MMRFTICALYFLLLAYCLMAEEPISIFQRHMDFDALWKFFRCDSLAQDQPFYKDYNFDDSGWETVQLPHTPRIEPLVVNDQWQGICWYRKRFRIGPEYRKNKLYVTFEGAMHTAEIWLNGRFVKLHEGGYLPFTIDITQGIFFDRENVLSVRLDNRDNPEIPPGKPLRELDFCWYGGLYRPVRLDILNLLHITDPVQASKEAGGGIFVQVKAISKAKADLLIQTHVRNESEQTRTFRIVSELWDQDKKQVGIVSTKKEKLGPFADIHLVQDLSVKSPKLWHPDHPHLYTLRSKIFSEDTLYDEVVTRIGIREISFSFQGFRINGEKFYLRGTNRHQEYPYIGYALPDNAQKRDAVLIKQSGFDFVRCSHYPPSPAFLDACDSLGILVMDAIPGWQFMGNKKFKELSYQNIRDMIRRDRNHPSIILWEVSLNETSMDFDFQRQCHTIAHAEYPGNQFYTSGWMDGVYDVFIRARQHGGCHGYWNRDKACFVSEYGDWEYYAQNAGFDQPGFRDLNPEARNSRQFRRNGEKRLLQQVMNFQEAHNDNLASPAIGDGVWVMFDYNRGYDTTIEASGVMDIFRLPKFATYFFQSQRKPDVSWGSPMVFIASYWMPDSSPTIRILSNCERVKLLLNGKEIGIHEPIRDKFSSRLAFPPFTFHLAQFEPGVIEAIGYIGDRAVASHSVHTPGIPQSIHLDAGLHGIPPPIGKKDVIFLYARLVDVHGTVVPVNGILIAFRMTGAGRLVGQNPMVTEAGIATILLETFGEPGVIEVIAEGEGMISGKIDIQIGKND